MTSNTMRLSGLIITHQLSEQATRWLARTAEVVDELVAVVAAPRAAPDVYERLESVGARIHHADWPTFYPSDAESRKMIAACTGDWILKIDHDEELSAEWFDPRWREILETDASHFWSPRRWLLSATEFLQIEPWWPDWQLRLFRNRPEEMTFPTELHQSMLMSGPGGYLRTLAIHHHDLWLATRAERERKAAIYEELRPGRGLGYFYLHEDCPAGGSPAPTASEFEIATEVLRMAPLLPDDIAALELRPHAPPAEMRAGELLWLDVEVRNGAASELAPGLPYPINLAYHWLDETTGAVAVWDGMRTAILPPLRPHSTAQLQMFIIAPNSAGTYLLQLTAVQEHLRWLESMAPSLAHSFRVIVR